MSVSLHQRVSPGPGWASPGRSLSGSRDDPGGSGRSHRGTRPLSRIAAAAAGRTRVLPRPKSRHELRERAAVRRAFAGGAPDASPAVADSDAAGLLDAEPTLTYFESVAVVAAAVAIAAAGRAAIGLPPLPHIPAALALWGRRAFSDSALFLVFFFAAAHVVTAAVLEPKWQAMLLPAERAAAPGGRFKPVIADSCAVPLRVHYVQRGRLAAPPGRQCSVLAFHGFGANAFSFDAACLTPLAERLGALAVAFDAPGFGFTERPRQRRLYDTPAVASLGLGLIAAVEAEQGLLSHGLSHGLSPQRLYVGHSLGGNAAAAAALADPHASGLVLIAPAIVAPERLRPLELPGTPALPAPLAFALALWRAATAALAALVVAALSPLLLLGLRAAVRSRDFWESGLRGAWHDPARLSPEIVRGYRRPGLAAGWDAGLLRFVQAKLLGGESVTESMAESVAAKSMTAKSMTAQSMTAQSVTGSGSPGAVGRGVAVLPLRVESLAAAAAAGLPVLLLHGATDALVPADNSRKLGGLIPGARVIVFPECGHVPQEEMPGKVVDAIADWAAEHACTP